MYVRILDIGFCEISDSGDIKLTTLAYSPFTALVKFKHIIACPQELSAMSFSSFLSLVSLPALSPSPQIFAFKTGKLQDSLFFVFVFLLMCSLVTVIK